MTVSFRRRLLAIAVLTLLACGAATAAILFFARATIEERTEHARDNVEREVEALRAVVGSEPPSVRPRALRQSGELLSGYLPPDAVSPSPLVDEARARAGATSSVEEMQRTDDGAPVIVAVAPLPGGGYVFALQHVVAGRETRSLRWLVLALALLTLALVSACLRMLAAVEKDVSSLRGSLGALASDLGAPVGRSAVRELDDVAQGIAVLAKKLRTASQEHDRLTTELADRERLAALGRVAAGIAHEVRNPLAAMKLRADLARTGGEATPAVARDLEDIGSEIARLDRLVSDLLVVAGRRSAGPKSNVDLRDLVARRGSLLGAWAAKNGVVITTKGRARADVDEDAIARAVDNLLRNAVEASPSGGKVEVSVQARGASVGIEVADEGPGVPADRAAELFEPFFTTKAEGTGLGLALARAVANAHDGTLHYARDEGKTRFVLVLRAAETRPADAPEAVG